MIDIDVSTVELLETTGFGILCHECQLQAKIEERNKKINKVINKTIWEKLKEHIK